MSKEQMNALRQENDLLKSILAGILPCPLSDAMVDAATHIPCTGGVSGPFEWGRIVGRNMVVTASKGNKA